eukprot:PhF_6_TR8489/c0_g1_i1/m.13279/K14803/PTC2_3; protein phosphatase PTC2/3
MSDQQQPQDPTSPNPIVPMAQTNSPMHRARTGSAFVVRQSDSNSFHLGASLINEGKCLRIDTGVSSIQGQRRTMEDQHVTAKTEGKSESPPVHFFAVYDGHGGTKCAEFLRDRLHKMVLDSDKVRDTPECVLKEAIAQVETDFTTFSRESKDCSGSTAAVAIIVNNDTLVTANVGDSEIVLCRAGKPLVLTTRHVPTNDDEQKRVLEAGGRMYRKRVGHPKFNPEFVSLGVSRAIGDIGFKLDEYTDGKQSGVIADADTYVTQLTKDDSFLLMACDGLWDVITYDEVVVFCLDWMRKGKTPQDITDMLVQEALLKGSTDNVTCLFIALGVGAGDNVASPRTPASPPNSPAVPQSRVSEQS